MLTFIVDNISLLTEQILVTWDFTPIFFVCIDKANNRYLVELTNYSYDPLNIDIYLISKISNQVLIDMLNGEITMRNAMLSGSKFWIIEADDEDVHKDRVFR